MAPDKHALFATLLPLSRTAIRSLALENGLGYDVVVQALLGRTSESGEGARLMADKLHGDADAALLEDVATLAETWPQPEQPAPVETQAGLDEEARRAVTRDEKAGALAPVTYAAGGAPKEGTDLAREVDGYNKDRDGFSKKLVVEAVPVESTATEAPPSS